MLPDIFRCTDGDAVTRHVVVVGRKKEGKARGRARDEKARSGAKRARSESEDETDEMVEPHSKRAKPEEKDRPKPVFAQPPLLTGATLKDYQLEGVAWMVSLWNNGISGILGEYDFLMIYKYRTQ